MFRHVAFFKETKNCPLRLGPMTQRLHPKKPEPIPIMISLTKNLKLPNFLKIEIVVHAFSEFLTALKLLYFDYREAIDILISSIGLHQMRVRRYNHDFRGTPKALVERDPTLTEQTTKRRMPTPATWQPTTGSSHQLELFICLVPHERNTIFEVWCNTCVTQCRAESLYMACPSAVDDCYEKDRRSTAASHLRIFAYNKNTHR